MMRVRRLLCAAGLSLVGPRFSYAIDLPPIEQPLPFGTNVIALPGPERVNHTSARTVELLGEELTRAGSTPERKAQLITDLGNTQLTVALTSLRKAATDTDPMIRATVATALGVLHDPESGDAIAKLVSDPDPEVRAEAVRAAASIGNADLLFNGLHDADPSVVAAALSVAGANDAGAIASLVANADPHLRVLAIEAVGRAKIIADADVVAAQLAGDVPTRVAAVQTLGALKSASHAQAVLKLLSDPHPTVRREATYAVLGVLPGNDARRHAIEMLEDSDDSVRTSAATVLAKVPGPEIVTPLVKQLPDPYGPLHEAVCTALVAAGNTTIPAAVTLLDDVDPRRRQDGSYLLGMLASDAGFEKHLKLLDDADWAVVVQTAKSLGQIGNTAAAPKLIRTLDRALAAIVGATSQSSDAAVKAAVNAVVSSAQLGYAPIGTKVSPYISDANYPPPLRAAAMWAVGVVGAPDEHSVFDRLPALVGNPLEATNVKIEAIKALGNRKSIVGQSAFEVAAKAAGSSQMFAIIHWSQDRISGKVTPFSLSPEVYQADTSVTAIAAP